MNGKQNILCALKTDSNGKRERNETNTRNDNKKNEQSNSLKSENKIQNWIMSGRNVNNLCMPNPLNLEQNGKYS